MFSLNSTILNSQQWILLAKSKGSSFARRTALSAPPKILCRLLLCSGLPEASFRTMLGRLDDIGKEGPEPYVDLIKSANLDSGESLNSAARSLLGRLNAYSRLYPDHSSEDSNHVPSIFSQWLSDHCFATAKRKASKPSKAKRGKAAKPQKLNLKVVKDILPTIELASAENGEEESSFVFDSPSFLVASSDADIPENRPTGNSESELAHYIESNLVERHCSDLDDWLTVTFGSTKPFDNDTISSLSVARGLLKCFIELKAVSSGVSRLVTTWVPRLSHRSGCPELWKLIFHQEVRNFQESNWMKTLITDCISVWSTEHKKACCKWASGIKLDGMSMNWIGLSVFLAATSEQAPLCSRLPDATLFVGDWASSKGSVIQLSRIALLGLQEESNFQPNDWPPGFSLVFSLAQCGKNQLRVVCEELLKGLSHDNSKSSVRICFLRLYLAFPHWVDIGSASVRTNLISAAGKYVDQWVHWLPTLDGQISDHIAALHDGDIQRAKVLSKLSRKHPLLILRELGDVTNRLILDATMTAENLERKGVVTGADLNGQRNARVHKKIVKFSLCHWGYSFLEPVWVSWLEILSAMPKEVLFTCGLEVGLVPLLNVYLQLASVQLQLLSIKKVERFKERLAELLNTFKQSNRKGWLKWLDTAIEGSKVRNMLMSYSFITMDELKASMPPPKK